MKFKSKLRFGGEVAVEMGVQVRTGGGQVDGDMDRGLTKRDWMVIGIWLG